MRDEPTTSPRDPAWTRAPLWPAEVWITFGDGDAPLTDAERAEAVSAAFAMIEAYGARVDRMSARWFGSHLRVMDSVNSALLDAYGRRSWNDDVSRAHGGEA